MKDERRIAYFSMEIGLEAGMETYSGGLGVLAGDTIRAAADLKVSMVAVTLIHRKGYFYQRLDPSGWQKEEPVDWVVDDFLTEMPERAAVTVEDRQVQIRAWKYEVLGLGGFKVPVYFLDADLAENSEWDRTLTHFLYGGDQHYRLCQEAILGIGGLRMLRALGYKSIERFHMNEAHSSLLGLELLDEEANKAGRQSIYPRRCRIRQEKVRLYNPYAGPCRSGPISSRLGNSCSWPQGSLRHERRFLLRGPPQHDLSRSQPESLHQWSRKKTWGCFATHVCWL
jgi:alpha-glucan phosphorylase-like protein